jgi:hypothetical protein
MKITYIAAAQFLSLLVILETPSATYSKFKNKGVPLWDAKIQQAGPA